MTIPKMKFPSGITVRSKILKNIFCKKYNFNSKIDVFDLLDSNL